MKKFEVKGRDLREERIKARQTRLTEAAAYFEQDLSTLLGKCESELEKLLATWLLTLVIDFDEKGSEWITATREIPEVLEPDTAFIAPQVKIGSYRVDFGIVYRCARWKRAAKIAIECDGHDYHDGTKEAAERDKRRNRALTTAGWKLLRFSGREIHRSPEDCISEVRALLSALYAGDVAP